MSRGIHPRVWSVATILVLICALSVPTGLFAQDEDATAAARKYRAGSGPAGSWIGEVKGPDGEKVEIRLQLDKVGDEWQGTLIDPFEGDLAANRLQVTQSRIGFTFRPEGAPFPAHFSGIYIAGDDRISGTVSQRGSSVLIKFKRDPDSIRFETTETGEPIIPARVRHPYHFAATVQAGLWPSLHVIKAENWNINTLTKQAPVVAGLLKYYVLDEFCVFGRLYRGGQNFTDDTKISRYADIGLSSDSYLKLDGWEVGVAGYFGNLLMRDSKFNPYLTGSFGKSTWELTEGERGSDIVEIIDAPVEGTDWGVAMGMGLEYEITPRVLVEAEWLWRYWVTEDEDIWDYPDDFWSNTHAWSLTLGATVGIW